MLKIKPHKEPKEKEEEARQLRFSGQPLVTRMTEESHLRKLMPIQAMSSVEFENEGVIDLGPRPDLAVHTEQQEKKEGKKVASIYLAIG